MILTSGKCSDHDRIAFGFLVDDGLKKMKKTTIARSIVVGDGYTDLPLLNRSTAPVLINRGQRRKERPGARHFNVVRSIPEILNIVSTKED
jgi:phosphoserine phosphatase